YSTLHVNSATTLLNYVKLRKPSLTGGGKDHRHRELVHDESERPQLAPGNNSLLPVNQQTEH
ncbi:hypothetical protein CEP52_017876, partial [Fusarium oligoseptatum]